MPRCGVSIREVLRTWCWCPIRRNIRWGITSLDAYLRGDAEQMRVMSAVIDNIPVMVAVLEMDPVMELEQWLLVTLTAGTGGSLLSVGSAAGVALMGQARGAYSFVTHLKWMPVIALGYASSIWLHLWMI